MRLKGKVLITLTKKEKDMVDRIVVRPLEEAGYQVITSYENAMLSEEELVRRIKDVDGYIVGLENVSERVIHAADRLRVVCKFGVGTDNIDKQAAARKGIRVTNCPGLNSNSVAELVLGLMFSLAREIPRLDEKMKDDKWFSSMGTEVTGKTLGIVGMGNIGKCLVKLVRGLNMKVLVYDVVPDESFAAEHGVTYVAMDQIITEADFISLHVPLTDETRDLIAQKQLEAMKKSAYLINTARGGVVNEDALLQALDTGDIAGAALDAFVNEPPTGSRLVKHEKVIALPHIGAATTEATERIAQFAMENILSVLEGRTPLSEVRE